MPKTIGCMLTWTMYGSWLQGDERRYVFGHEDLAKGFVFISH